MINVKEQPFNAVGDGRDDYPAFAAALAHLRVQAFNAAGAYQGAERLYIPAGHYFLSQTLDIKGMSLIIEGESCGQAGGYATVLQWPACTTGIRIQRYNTIGTAKELPATKGADATILRNLALYGGGGTGAFHGIHGRARFVAEDVFVKEFAHSGIYIHATSGGSNDSEGNANGFALSRLRTVRNGVAGLWVQGADANAGVAMQVNSSGNDQYGIYDDSFLGNTYVGCHTSGNGQKNSQVSHNCNRYHVFYGKAGLASTTEPGTDPAVWRLISAGDADADHPLWVSGATYLDGGAASHNCNRYRVVPGQAALASTTEPGTNPVVWRLTSRGGASDDYPLWVSGTTYLDGGAYVSVSNSAASVFLGCYSEGGQPASYVSSPALVIGGLHGAGTYGTASVLAGRLTGLEVSPSLFTSGAHGTGTSPPVTVRLGSGATGARVALEIVSGDDPRPYRLLYNNSATGDRVGWWEWNWAQSGGGNVLAFCHLKAPEYYEKIPNTVKAWLPRGFYIGMPRVGGSAGDDGRVYTSVGKHWPTAGIWSKGDRVLNNDPTPGDAILGCAGWICVEGSSATHPHGTWVPFGQI